MPLTFGAATSDNVALALFSNVGATGQAMFFGGWFYPTTLTAGRCYMSFVGSNPSLSYSVKVAATTSALQLGSNTGTTAGVWSATADSTLFPSGITTNNWWFIAGLATVVTGPTITWKAWLGDANTAPTAMTVTQTTAPVGVLGSTTTVCMGNDRLTAASPTVAFQGDIGMVNVISGASGVNTLLPIATPGSVSADEQALIEQTYVLPLWSGRALSRYPRDGATNNDWLICEFRDAATYTRVALGTATQVVFRGVGTTSGATASARREPNVSDVSANVRYPPIRR